MDLQANTTGRPSVGRPSAEHSKAEPEAKSQWDTALRNLANKLYNRAMLNLKEAIKLDRAYLKESHTQLDNYLRIGQSEKAVAVGLAITTFEPKNTKLINQIGNAYRGMGRYKQALRLYQGALKIDPKFVFARYNLAACYFKIQKFDQNLLRQTQLVEKFVIYRRTYYQLSYNDPVPQFENQEFPKQFSIDQPLDKEEFHVKEADVEGAEIWLSQFEEQAKAHPESWEHQFDLAIVYDIGRFNELALNQYQKALKLSPQNPLIENNLAIALSEYKQDYEKVKEIFLDILKRDRCNRTVFLNLAVLHRKIKKPFTSLKYYTYLGELLTKSHGLFDVNDIIKTADECYENGERNKAIDLYKSLLEEKDNPEWMFRIGILYKQLRKYKSAIQYWQKTLEQDPDYQNAHEELNEYVDNLKSEAEELIDDNFLSDAASLLELAVSIYPTLDIYEELAEIFDQLEEDKLADKYATLAKQMSSEQPPVK